jgi:hypothetical protein
MKIALTSIAAVVSLGLASLTSAHATPISQVPASPTFSGNGDAVMLQLIQDDDYPNGGARWRYRKREGDPYGRRRYDDDDDRYRPRYGDQGGGYGRRRYGDDDGGYGRLRDRDGGDARARRLRIIWCTQHPGRC